MPFAHVWKNGVFVGKRFGLSQGEQDTQIVCKWTRLELFEQRNVICEGKLYKTLPWPTQTRSHSLPRSVAQEHSWGGIAGVLGCGRASRAGEGGGTCVCLAKGCLSTANCWRVVRKRSWSRWKTFRYKTFAVTQDSCSMVTFPYFACIIAHHVSYFSGICFVSVSFIKINRLLGLTCDHCHRGNRDILGQKLQKLNLNQSSMKHTVGTGPTSKEPSLVIAERIG